MFCVVLVVPTQRLFYQPEWIDYICSSGWLTSVVIYFESSLQIEVEWRSGLSQRRIRINWYWIVCSPLILGDIKYNERHFASIFLFLLNKSCGSFDSRDEWKLIMDNSVSFYSRWSPRHWTSILCCRRKQVCTNVHPFRRHLCECVDANEKKKFCALLRQADQPQKGIT